MIFHSHLFAQLKHSLSFKSTLIMLALTQAPLSWGSTPSPTQIHPTASQLRVRSFTEWMSPAFTENGSHVPTDQGTPLTPTHSFNIVWADYTLTQHFKLLFWQRYKTFFGVGENISPLTTRFRNPRLALRWVNFIKNPNVSATYDFYIQPGFAPEAQNLGRNLEFGFRTVTQYSIPTSRLRIGATTEFTISTSPTPFNRGQNYYGWLTTALLYDLSPKLSAQSFITVNFKQNRGTRLTDVRYDTPLPFIQNGVGYQITPSVSTSLLLNNYLNQAPTLRNTWASLWFSIAWI
jgi:hypothetical protein